MKPAAQLPHSELLFWTRHYFYLSSTTDRPRSFYHRFYYACAAECERRGINLTQILKGINK